MDGGLENAVTRTLRAAAEGSRQAAADLLPLVYEELRKLARSRMAGLAPGQTLQATALVHEAYLRIAGAGDPVWEGRGHFFAAAARAMREILMEEARRKASGKRGRGWRRMELDSLPMAIEAPSDNLLALDEALRKLQEEDPRKHELVMLRFFAGLTAEESAEALGISLRTVERDWRYVRAWLRMELGAGKEAERDDRAANRPG